MRILTVACDGSGATEIYIRAESTEAARHLCQEGRLVAAQIDKYFGGGPMSVGCAKLEPIEPGGPNAAAEVPNSETQTTYSSAREELLRALSRYTSL